MYILYLYTFMLLYIHVLIDINESLTKVLMWFLYCILSAAETCGQDEFKLKFDNGSACLSSEDLLEIIFTINKDPPLACRRILSAKLGWSSEKLYRWFRYRCSKQIEKVDSMTSRSELHVTVYIFMYIHYPYNPLT